MTDNNGLSETGSLVSFTPNVEQILPPGSALALDTIESMARKIEQAADGDVRDWAREIVRLAGGLIEQYQQDVSQWAVNG